MTRPLKSSKIPKPAERTRSTGRESRTNANPAERTRSSGWCVQAEMSGPRGPVLPPNEEEEVREEIPTRANASAELVVLAGPSAGARFTLTDFPVWLGRSEQCQVWLQDDPREPTLSRKHACLMVAGGRIHIEDHSVNGTVLDGVLLQPQRRVPLTGTHRLRLGSTTELHLELGDGLALEVLPDRTEASAHLRLHTLGRFAVWLDGREIPSAAWDTRKPMLLLAYLAGGGASAERICEDLWPDNPAGGKQALQSSLSRLRKALRFGRADSGPERVLFERGRYRLQPDLQLEYDVEELERTLRSTSDEVTTLERVEQLYRGAFLDGFPEEWVWQRRREVTQSVISGVNALLPRISPGERVLELCRGLLRVDSCWEQVHLMLLQCLLEAGHRTEALRHYQHYTQLLRRQLNLEPGEALLRLYYARIQGG